MSLKRPFVPKSDVKQWFTTTTTTTADPPADVGLYGSGSDSAKLLAARRGALSEMAVVSESLVSVFVQTHEAFRPS